MKTYRTSPPAKLNLFLEILARRPDGFHELDTVMVAIDWRDELTLRPSPEPGIRLEVDWLPDRASVARQMAVDADHPLLEVPNDARNLVYRALLLINEATGYRGGWDVRLGKRIPSGAGMGGASSDAAATLRLAATALADLASTDLEVNAIDGYSDASLVEMAETLGSDVPFFLNPDFSLARATGRGEKLEFHALSRAHRFVVIYPAVSLSTPEVYRECCVSASVRSAGPVINAFCGDAANPDQKILYNALQNPARRLAPRVGEALDCIANMSMLQGSMTGSGSACFVWAVDTESSLEPTNGLVELLRGKLNEGGALIRAATTCMAASEIHIA